MNNKSVLLTIAIGLVCIIVGYMADSPYRKQVQEFTKKCHGQNGVVVQEHDTKNLLCFPSDF